MLKNIQGATFRLKHSRKPLSKNAKNTCDPPLNAEFAQLINGGSHVFFALLESGFWGFGNMTNMVWGVIG